MKKKFIAALLAFIGWPLGLHKFYLREPGAGVFYIFLTIITAEVFPVSLILGFIDGLRYLMMSPADFDRKFNNRMKRPNPRIRQKPRASSSPVRRSEVRAGRMRNNPFKKSGLKKYKDFDIEESIDDFHKALKIDPQDVSIYFNLACAYSLMENKEKAFNYLELAVAKGLTDQQRILSHDDLAYIRIQPEFEEFKLAGFRSASHPEVAEDQEVPSEKPMDDILLAQLNRLMELRKKGVLTEQEFIRERKKVLAR